MKSKGREVGGNKNSYRENFFTIIMSMKNKPR